MLPLRHHAPPAQPLIDLRCVDARLVDWPEADLVIADPCWDYHEQAGESAAGDHYECLGHAQIADILNALVAPRMAMWITWPHVGQWGDEIRTRDAWRWGRREKTGGVWVKSGDPSAWLRDAPSDEGHYGQGFHWAGCSEPIHIYSRGGGYTNRAVKLRNAWIEAPKEHSRKPVGWQVQMVQRWCPPGGLVLDPFAGLGSVAEAVALAGEGRRYLGTEIDPERHAQALALIAQRRAA